MAPDMHRGHSIINFVHIQQVHPYIAIQCATMHDNKMHIAVSFPITVDTINTCRLIMKLIRSATILIDNLSKYAHAGTL